MVPPTTRCSGLAMPTVLAPTGIEVHRRCGAPRPVRGEPSHLAAPASCLPASRLLLSHKHMTSDATSLERIPTVIVTDHDELGRLVAGRIARLVRQRAAEKTPAVLGLATGSTPVGVYRELVRMHREEGLSFRHVVTFNLDEYYPMPPDSIHSYHRYMWENLFAHIDIEPANVHIPRGDIPRDEVDDFCYRYEAEIERAGGIDFQILGIGKTGHIGFNEPGSGAESRTRVVLLDAITRLDAAA